MREQRATYNGHVYVLEAATEAEGTDILKSRGVNCSPRACGQRIPRGEDYLFLVGQGRMCCRCAVRLGALLPALPAAAPSGEEGVL